MTAVTLNQTQRKGITRTIVMIVALVALFLGLFMHKMLSPRIMSKAELATNGAIVFDNPRIIKPFELKSSNGEAFNLASLEGRWTLLYFGFTHCPDICPTSLALLSKMYAKLDKEIQKQTQIVLISVDPARDNAEKLNEYMAFFNEDFLAVSGEFLNTKRFADNLNVAFNKVVLDDGDYTVDHTGNIVVVNPKGHYHGFYRPPFALARLKGVHQSVVSSC